MQIIMFQFVASQPIRVTLLGLFVARGANPVAGFTQPCVRYVLRFVVRFTLTRLPLRVFISIDIHARSSWSKLMPRKRRLNRHNAWWWCMYVCPARSHITWKPQEGNDHLRLYTFGCMDVSICVCVCVCHPFICVCVGTWPSVYEWSYVPKTHFVFSRAFSVLYLNPNESVQISELCVSDLGCSSAVDIFLLRCC